MGDLKNAFESYDMAIKLDPKHANAYSNRGVAYNDMGDFKNAIESYNIAIQLEPNHVNGFLNCGYTYNCMGDFKSAIESCNMAINLDPNHANAYNNRGYTYNCMGDFKNAIASCNMATKINPTHSLAFYNRGMSYYFLKQFESSLDELNVSIKCNKLDKQVSMAKHEVYLIGIHSVVNLILGNIDHSNKSFEKLINLGDKNVVLLFEGILQLNKNNYQQALAILDKMDSSGIQPPFKAYMSAAQGFLCLKLNQSGCTLVELQSPEWRMEIWQATVLLPHWARDLINCTQFY